MKFVTALLLLCAIGVVSLNGHRDADAPSATERGFSTSVAVSGYDTAVDEESVNAGVSDSPFSALSTVCIFALVCCVLLAVAGFVWRRGRSRVMVALSPRGSPSWTVPVSRGPSALTLAQLSISRI